MKKNLLLTSLLSFIISIAVGQAPKEKTLLWKISGKNAQTSYLYGTMHLMCPSDIVLSNPLNKAFESAEQLYLEINIDDPAVMREAMTAIVMKDNQSLDSLIPKSTYDSISTTFQQLSGIPLMFMKRMQPMLIMSAIYPGLLKCPVDGWEKQFISKAKQQNIPILGLETVQDQVNAFSKIPYKTQALMLVSTLNNTDSTKKSFEKMVSIYKSKDLTALAAMVNEDNDFSSYEEDLLTVRNNNWIAVIEKSIASKKTFIAVGAAHLAGNNGVIHLLRKQGYKVEPVFE